jgi:uncharacterized repeat protein (TIGR03803 family)
VTATDAAGNVSQQSDALSFVVDTTEPATPVILTDSAGPITLNTLASFNYGASSTASLIADANGDLFGTTYYGGGTYNAGTVFEIVKTASGYASTPTTLVSFNIDDGGNPYAGLIADSNGDLFGTTESGGANGYGTVFEIVKTAAGYANTPTILVSFDGSSGAAAGGNLIADANGDLFGTNGGGPNDSGTVFEIVKTASGYASTPSILVSFNGSNGAGPSGDLIADVTGDLFGTTEDGGANGQGTVFEIVKTAAGYANTPTILVSFDGSSGAVAGGHLIADANGNLFGTTYGSGANTGTVFEIVKTASGYASTPTTLVSNIPTKEGSLFADANGDLFGTTTYGPWGGGSGSVFEIVKTASGYASTLTALITFDWSNGAYPYAGLIADANGDLFGTTSYGGTDGYGTVFEITGTSADSAVVNGYVNAANDTTAQTLTGTAENGSKVTIYDNGTQVGTATADVSTGVWSFPIGTLADASAHSYRVTATDAAGNDSALSDALSFTVDTTVPAKPAAPADSAVINGFVNLANDTANQALTGTAENGSTVTIYDNGTQVGTATANGSTGAWSLPIGQLADGSRHSYAVTATDAAGNVSQPSAALNFTVDITAPATPAAPADSAVVNGYVNAAHDTAAQALTGSAEDGSTVTVFDNGSLVGTTTATATSGAWSLNIGQLADGSAHSYTVTATDAAGNVSQPSAALSFTVDITAPATPAAPSDSAVVNGYVNAAHDTAAQALTGSAEKGSTVTVYDNGNLVGSTAANVTTGSWNYIIGQLADAGAHSYTVTATDAAGNTSQPSAALNFTVDITPPITPAAPADGAVVNGYVNAAHDSAAQALTGSAENGSTVTVYDNGSFVGSTAANATTGAWSFTIGDLADASAHSYTVAATDAAGNTSQPSAALNFTVDITPPMTPAAPADGAVVNGYVNVAHDTLAQALTGSAEKGSTVTVYDNGNFVGSTTANASTGFWSYTIGQLADAGTHSYTVTATDAAGNVSQPSAALNFTVDVTPPATPAAPADSAVINSYVNAAHDTAAQALTGSAEDGSTVTIYDNGSFVGSTAANATTGAWSFPIGQLADAGAHSYTVTATDAAGNVSQPSAALNFTVDITAPATPAAPADSAVVGGYVNAAHDTVTQALTGTVEKGSTVKIYDNGMLLGSTAANAATGAWSFPIGHLADAGTHSYTVTATDAAGNTSQPSAALSFAVDTDAGQQAALKLTVGATAISAAAAASVPFTIAGLQPEDTGTVTFTDVSHKTVVINVTGNQTSYTANLSSLADGAITSSLAVNADAAGNSFTPVAGSSAMLTQLDHELGNVERHSRCSRRHHRCRF